MRILALTFVFALAQHAPAYADPALDRIFDLKQLETIESGKSVTYSHIRSSGIGEALPDINEGKITLAIEGEETRTAVLELTDGKRSRRLEDFPGDGGNPVLMAFLEMVTRAVSRGTGGSPFYIRNRIKDAFSRGTPIEDAEDGDQIVYRPFERETTKDRLGAFSGLELVFVLDEKAPGGFRKLHAKSGKNGDGYRELIDLTPEEDAQ